MDYRELPSDYLEKMKKLLKEEFEDYLTCFSEPPHYGLRVNRLKCMHAGAICGGMRLETDTNSLGR